MERDGKGWQPLLWARQGCAKVPRTPLGHPEPRAHRERANDKAWAEMPEKGRIPLSPVASGEGAQEP